MERFKFIIWGAEKDTMRAILSMVITTGFGGNIKKIVISEIPLGASLNDLNVGYT